MHDCCLSISACRCSQHALLCAVIAGCSALLLRELSHAMPLEPARQPSSQRLLLSFAGLTAAVFVIQVVSLC